MILFEVVLCFEMNYSLCDNLKMLSNKSHFTAQYETCQYPKLDNTLEYNYITSEKLIEQTIQKYQDILY